MTTKTCAQCQKDFVIRDWDKSFYEKIEVPFPKNCPDCRLLRRFMERNPKTLYYRNCDFTNKPTLSQYHKNQTFPVYNTKDWWSDDWEALDYGQEINFEKSFFEQFLILKNKVPHLALFNLDGTIENSDYNNCTGYLKNCYLIAESDYDENCYYSNLLKNCNSVMDSSICYQNELCYECVDCNNSYRLFYSQDCLNCKDSYFLSNCNSCSDCIGCINQRRKQYMIFNKQYSKDDYKKYLENFNLNSNAGVEKLRLECERFFETQVHPNVVVENNENSSGDHLYNSKNAYQCFDCTDLEDCAYCAKLSLHVKSSMDYNSWGAKSELIYQSAACGDNAYNLKFCTNCTTNMINCEYCAGCFSCSDCFGCVGLKKKKYCIFNKQYTEEEYHVLKEKLIAYMRQIGEYGEFFPVSICPFAYNETMAMDAFVMTKSEAESKGFAWYEEDPKVQVGQTYKFQNSIENTDRDICSEVLFCACNKNYKIVPQEFDFYKNLQIPIPRVCPTCRHRKRMAKRNPLKLWLRNCEACKKEITSNYSNESLEPIYCKECYLKEIYS